MTVSKAKILAARKALSRLDAALAKADAVVPPFTWRSKPAGFAGLARLIIEQQVSVASANAIWKRFEEGLGVLEPKRILAHDIDKLKTFGLSAPKAKYILGVAQALKKGEISLDELSRLDDEAATAKLIALNGIGRWTAEAYLMGCEARTDVFPAADIALQEAVRILDGVAHRPTTAELYVRAANWRPYRSIAAHLLWDYYTAIKKNVIPMPPGVPPMVKLTAGKKPAGKKPVKTARSRQPKKRAARR